MTRLYISPSDFYSWLELANTSDSIYDFEMNFVLLTQVYCRGYRFPGCMVVRNCTFIHHLDVRLRVKKESLKQWLQETLTESTFDTRYITWSKFFDMTREPDEDFTLPPKMFSIIWATLTERDQSSASNLYDLFLRTITDALTLIDEGDLNTLFRVRTPVPQAEVVS